MEGHGPLAAAVFARAAAPDVEAHSAQRQDDRKDPDEMEKSVEFNRHGDGLSRFGLSYRVSRHGAKGSDKVQAAAPYWVGMAKSMKIPATISGAFAEAKATRLNAHAPYSNFQVGAALVTKDGEIITGCNVENASYGGTVCAERIAIFKAVSEKHHRFSDIVIVTDAADPAPPCAFCLQVMAEFFEPSTKIWLGDLSGVRSSHTFKSLLPIPFGPRQLKEAKASASSSPVKKRR